MTTSNILQGQHHVAKRLPVTTELLVATIGVGGGGGGLMVVADTAVHVPRGAPGQVASTLVQSASKDKFIVSRPAADLLQVERVQQRKKKACLPLGYILDH